jgi:hypothetical protein
VLQALIDADATQQIGADRYQRSQQRTTHRNGFRSRLLSPKAGDVELRIPKLREGSFFPSLLEPRRRIDRRCWRWSWRLTKENPGCWTRRRAFAQVKHGSNIQLLLYSLVCAQLRSWGAPVTWLEAATDFRSGPSLQLC